MLISDPAVDTDTDTDTATDAGTSRDTSTYTYTNSNTRYKIQHTRYYILDIRCLWLPVAAWVEWLPVVACGCLG